MSSTALFLPPAADPTPAPPDQLERLQADLRWYRRECQFLRMLLTRRQEQLDTAHAAIAQRDHEIARLDPSLEPAL